jgi:predicted dehydrogenase
MGLPLGIGVIGCGVISDIYLRRCATFPQIEARAVADMNMAAAEKRGAEHGVPAMSVEALLAHPDVDIVLNLTVPAAHVAVGLQAVAAGKHVYAEKPLGTSVAEARKLVEAAAARGVRVGSAPDTFLGGAHQTARAAIDAGRIGVPLGGSATLMLAGHERWHPNPDFYYSHPGGGPAMDMAPYYVTALVNLLGPVARVTAFASRPRTTRTIATGPRAGQTVPVEVDTHIAGALEFAQGAVVQIAMSFDVKGHKHTPLEIYGSEGSLIVPDPNWFKGDIEILTQPGGAWEPVAHTHGHGDDNYRGLGLADMAAAIDAGRPHRASGELALHVMEVIESLHVSAASGAAVRLTTTCARPAPFAPGLALGDIK